MLRPYALGTHDALGSHVMMGTLDGHVDHIPVDVRFLHLNLLMYVAIFKDRKPGPI